MRTGLYTLAELFGNRHIAHLVIPEIQRDYVWRSPQVKHLLASLLANFQAWRQAITTPALEVVMVENRTSDLLDPAEVHSLQNQFTAFQARRRYATNVGFVYAYCDADLPGQYFLIDGQQRLTSLYLTLLAVASGNTALGERFRARYCLPPDPHCTEESAATRLDYRLRDHTAAFFRRCVRHLLQDPEGAATIAEQSWFLRRLETDQTIRNLIANFVTIRDILGRSAYLRDDWHTDFYEYLENLVECWYFDTNESAQGEELYIYLNARGESIADNENLKARLLGELRDPLKKAEWGRTWEVWQDYFWTNRHRGLREKLANSNADRGFNAFLACIQGFMAFQRKTSGDPVGTTSVPMDLVAIHKFIDILRWLENARKIFAVAYPHADWVEAWFDEFWQTLNQKSATNWAADFQDDNRSTERNRMVLVWGSLLCALHASDSDLEALTFSDVSRTFRAIRFLYLRFHNNNRSVASLTKLVPTLLAGDITTAAPGELTGEEFARAGYFAALSPDELIHHESVLWQIEDHPWNLKGSDLGNTNLIHLVDLADVGTTLGHLEQIRDAFYELFPDANGTSTNSRKVALALLHYGPFWNRDSPWYYENLDFRDWRRTIRGLGSAETKTPDGSNFRRFFKDYVATRDNLDSFLSTRRQAEALKPEDTTDLREALLWYGERLGIGMFAKGMYIAVSPALPQGMDAVFPAFGEIWNTQGHFKGTKGYYKLSDSLQLQDLSSLATAPDDHPPPALSLPRNPSGPF